ncbi:hypothetical protein E2C01_080789 [Portunus trituberculatus]|uniref:Uncharacterized protein n=1 Tax=Portunus trituberculatus TaxID=210409 RepID=A0A5B7IN80_PORTR|nr:hypothetical protein [Portunus trituberculatus]
MRFDGDMGPNMGTTLNEIAYTTNDWKLNSASNTLQVIFRSDRPGYKKICSSSSNSCSRSSNSSSSSNRSSK